MSALSQPVPDWDTVPAGTEWPGPDTVVLLHRPLRPGTDPLALSRFAEYRWNVDPAIFEEHAKAKSLNFTPIPRPLRQDAKHYIWQLINHPRPGTMRHSGGGDRPAVATILTVFSAFKELMIWLHRHGITAFAEAQEEVRRPPPALRRPGRTTPGLCRSDQPPRAGERRPEQPRRRCTGAPDTHRGHVLNQAAHRPFDGPVRSTRIRP